MNVILMCLFFVFFFLATVFLVHIYKIIVPSICICEMGVSIVTWRARIGRFICSQKCKDNFKMYNYGKGLGMSTSHISVIVLAYLLIIGCVEIQPGPTVEELILQSQNAVTTLITSYKSETLEAVNALTTKVNSLDNTVQALSTQINGMQQSIDSTNSRINALEQENKQLHQKIDQIDNNYRKNNILVFGLDEVGESDNNTAAAEFASFANSKLGIDIGPNIICNAYRIGTTIGHRPLFVQFSQYKYKMNIMANVRKLKGTKISISDDLTPTARLRKKRILQCASEARSAGLEVRVRNQFLLINNIKVNEDMMKQQNWLQVIQQKEISSTNDRKRMRTESSSPHTDVNKEARQSHKNDGSHGSRMSENAMPPPQGTEGGGIRDRSSSRGKREKKKLTQTQ
jgi:outer membrane murein-binding lipoprotein Lpp